MKLYRQISNKKFSYDEIVPLMINGAVATRPEWDGFHFIFFGNYIIFTKDKKIIINPENIYDIDKNDWILVTPTEEGFKESYRILKNIFDLTKIMEGNGVHFKK